MMILVLFVYWMSSCYYYQTHYLETAGAMTWKAHPVFSSLSFLAFADLPSYYLA
jgi:hypothetical protein